MIRSRAFGGRRRFRAASFHHRASFVLLCIVAFAVVLGASRHSHACSIPVFRYALQFWEPDQFELLVFHRGAMTEAAETVAHALERATLTGDPVNLSVRRIDLDGAVEPKARQLWDSIGDSTLPHVVLRFPARYSGPEVVHSGALKDFDLAPWLDSPLRQEIRRRLARGDSAVWVLVESGDSDKDATAQKVLEDTLAKLEKSLKLPELAAADIGLSESGAEVSAPLAIKFSVLRMRQGDGAEKSLRDLLLRSEADLAELTDQPMVFAVFGRGRVLPALVGAGINEENVTSSASFLVGPCSCQVKEENPGFDFLARADWATLLAQANAGASSSPPRLDLSSSERGPSGAGGSHSARNVSDASVVAASGGTITDAAAAASERSGSTASSTASSTPASDTFLSRVLFLVVVASGVLVLTTALILKNS